MSDPSFDELYARIVPVEVCCVHAASGGNSGLPNSSAAANLNSKKQSAAAGVTCLHMNSNSSRLHHHTDFMADLRSTDMAPGTPTSFGMPGGPTGGACRGGPFGTSGLGGPETLDACLCPNCCPNTYSSSASAGGVDGSSGDQRSGSSAKSGGQHADSLASVAVQRITVRVLGQKARYAAQGRLLPTSFRVELSCDDSLFFLFSTTIDEAAFNELKESCDLSLSFQQLPGLLLQLLDLLVRQPSTYLARLFMKADGSAALEFAQTLGFKTLNLLLLPNLDAVPPSMLRGYVTARHNTVLERCAAAEAELAELKALVRQRCPNLLLQAGKAPSPSGNRPGGVIM